MKIISAKYYSQEIPDDGYEDFINNLFVDLKRYERSNPDFKFKMDINEDHVEVKTVKMNESKN